MATAYPECRLVVTKETLTVEGMINVYSLLKDKLNIVKLTFTSGENAASEEFITKCRLVVTKETLTVEGMINVYSLLKDKLNIVKLTFTSGENAASEEFITKK